VFSGGGGGVWGAARSSGSAGVEQQQVARGWRREPGIGRAVGCRQVEGEQRSESVDFCRWFPSFVHVTEHNTEVSLGGKSRRCAWRDIVSS